uniref:GG16495 n=1 Tax=Drosophila erecta TaxID=7220 RepID=B3P271_DROER
MQIAQIVYALGFAHRFDFVILLYILRLICSSPPYFPYSVSFSVCVYMCVSVYVVMRLPSLSLFRAHAAACAPFCVFLFFLSHSSIDFSFFNRSYIVESPRN